MTDYIDYSKSAEHIELSELKYTEGDKVRVVNDISSVNGTLYKDTIVKVKEIDRAFILDRDLKRGCSEMKVPWGQVWRGPIKVLCPLSKIWWVNIEDLKNE